jgi:hypothetical protein
MSGKGICYDNAAVETFFKTIKAELICGTPGTPAGMLRWRSSNTSTASTIHNVDTQHRAGKAPSLSKEKWLKRALGAAQKRDRSKAALEEAGSGLRDVVRTRVILTDIENWKEAIEARKKFCTNARPVDTIMAVTRFVNPEWLVEIEVGAVIAD